VRAYGFVDWSGDTGFKFALGSSSHLVLSLVSSTDYAGLRQGLIRLRAQLGLPQAFEFHFARNSQVVRTAFFATLPHFAWEGALLVVDKRRLSVEFARMHTPSFYSFFLAQLLARAPLDLLTVKRILVDSEVKNSPLIRNLRVVASPVLLARGLKQTPKVRGEPARRWDGLQVADMLAGAMVTRENGGTDYLRGLGRHLWVYHYEATK